MSDETTKKPTRAIEYRGHVIGRVAPGLWVITIVGQPEKPLALGADVVVHSTTKYLGGHSDVIGGGLVVSDAELGDRLAYHQNAMGSVPGPWDSWLVLRGI